MRLLPRRQPSKSPLSKIEQTREPEWPEGTKEDYEKLKFNKSRRVLKKLEKAKRAMAALLYLRLLLEQDGPQDEKAGYDGSQFRLFEHSELRNCRLRQLFQDARKSCLKYNDTASRSQLLSQ